LFITLHNYYFKSFMWNDKKNINVVNTYINGLVAKGKRGPGNEGKGKK
jgi:hypothetical protein